MRCLGCKYELTSLSERRCPECGRAFDPDDRSTFRDAQADEDEEKQTLPIAIGMSLGVSIGAGVGVALGAAFGNVGVGIGIGTALGAALGIVAGAILAVRGRADS